MPERLPDTWVARIFSTLRSTYGIAFDRQWECPPTQDPIAFARDLADHWARELRAWGSKDKAHAIGWALDNLPPAPPNLVQFKQLVRSAPAPVVQTISYTPDPVKARAALEKVGEVIETLKPGSPENSRKWAAKLLERHRQGGRLTVAQRSALAEAIKNGAVTPEEPRP